MINRADKARPTGTVPEPEQPTAPPPLAPQPAAQQPATPQMQTPLPSVAPPYPQAASQQRRPTADPLDALLEQADHADLKATNLLAEADSFKRQAEAEAERILRAAEDRADAMRQDAEVLRQRADRWRQIVRRERQSEAPAAAGGEGPQHPPSSNGVKP